MVASTPQNWTQMQAIKNIRARFQVKKNTSKMFSTNKEFNIYSRKWNIPKSNVDIRANYRCEEVEKMWNAHTWWKGI